jgi:digeranylgeranylglycerophospholipid reductase
MLDKFSIFIRGAINKRLADDLKHTAEVNKKLVEHYNNYPDRPEKFLEWQKKLLKYMEDAFLHLGRH